MKFLVLYMTEVEPEAGGWMGESCGRFDGQTYREGLFECTDDDVPIRCLGIDGGEPEDQTFCRDWAWVGEEMNRLADENRRLLAELNQLKEDSGR